MSESLLLGILLAVVGGFLEAYAFVGRGGVFANCQTGNLVLFALYAAGGVFTKALTALLPAAAFVFGVFVAEIIKWFFRKKPMIHWRQIILLFEILCLAAAGFIPGGKLDILVTTLIAFICSLQVDGFRKLRGSQFATTMCTGNLRSGTENLFSFLHGKEQAAGKRALHYFLIVLFFMAGAVLGAAVTAWIAEKAALICCLPLLAAFLLMFIRNPGEQAGEEQSIE